jgi:hypothetical protein
LSSEELLARAGAGVLVGGQDVSLTFARALGPAPHAPYLSAARGSCAAARHPQPQPQPELLLLLLLLLRLLLLLLLRLLLLLLRWLCVGSVLLQQRLGW